MPRPKNDTDFRKTIRMGEKIHKAARVAAAYEDCTMQDWVERAIKGRIEELGLGVLLKPPKIAKTKG